MPRLIISKFIPLISKIQKKQIKGMCRIFSFLFIVVFSVFLTGCTTNGVRALPLGSSVTSGHAIVVFGVGVENNFGWKFPNFGINLDKYDIESQTAGNCVRFDRMEAMLPSSLGLFKYFAFDVPPGAYVYSVFNGAPLANIAQLDSQKNSRAFIIPEGRVVYIGDFILQHQTTVVRLNLDAFRNEQKKSLPDLTGEIFLAEAVAVKSPKSFLCSL